MNKRKLVAVLALVIIAVIAATFFFLQKSDKPIPPQAETQAETQAESTLPPATPENLLAEVNKQRAAAGVAPLAISDKLNQSAMLKCEDMAKNGYYAHQNPATGKQGYEYIEELLPTSVIQSENLNKGFFDDAYTVVSDPAIGWMGSKPHREAMLSPKLTDTGFASCSVRQNTTGATIASEIIFVQHMAKMP